MPDQTTRDTDIQLLEGLGAVPMRYKLACDFPGRLRVRYGRVAFTDEEGYGIAESLLGIPGVQKVITSTANGSVLVVYDEDDPAARTQILSVLGGLGRHGLPTGTPTDDQRQAEIDDKFARDLLGIIAKRYLLRLVLPAPIRHVRAVIQAVPFIVKGVRCLMERGLTVEVLDATAITASLLRGSFDSAGTIMMLLKISELMERYTHARSRMALEQSLGLNIDEVWLVAEDGSERQVPLARIGEGDLIRVRTGCMVPVDGTVVAGEAALNEASMTGESRLVPKEAGSSVFAGTVLEEGTLDVRVRQAGADTRISRIVSMVEDSEKLKAGAQSRAERLADAIVPFNLLAFAAVFAITRNVEKAMAVLMVDYSCAIKLSTPVAIMSAMREAARDGMLIKGGRYLEMMADADTIIFDKTGTLTTAQPKVRRVIALGDMPEDDVLRLGACLEEHFPHSVARAVVAEAQERGVNHDRELHAEVEYVVAHGLASTVNGKRAFIGSWHFVFEDEGVTPPPRLRARMSRMAPGCSIIYLAVNGELQGAICIDDPVRDEAAGTIAQLREAGFRNIVMLTGDAENAARKVARELGIDEYRSQVLPEDKARIIEEYRKAGHVVAMVGDGVNDSPALAKADVSIAMVDASDIAREVADITLLDSSLDAILKARALSCALMTRIQNDYRFIVAFNTALIVFGVAGVLPNTTSALLHNGSTMLITARNMTPLMS